MDTRELQKAYGRVEPWSEGVPVALGQPAVAAVAAEVSHDSDPLVDRFYQQVPHRRDPLTEPAPLM